MPKADCKYWEKCYQKNEYHLQKYNHPPKKDTAEKNRCEEKDKDEEKPIEKITTIETNTTTTNSNRNIEKKEPKEEVEEAATEEEKEKGKIKMNINENQKKAPKRTSCNGDDDDDNNDDVDDDSKMKETKSKQDDEIGAGKKLCDEEDDMDAKYETAALREEALSNIAGKNYMEILRKRIKLSVQAEYDDLLRSNEFIRHKFLVEMPPDFYAFWKFACELKTDCSGEEILKYLEKTFQLLLVGPFEFLAGRFHNAKIHEPGDYTRHWRFFYDVPEFQTVFVKKDTGIHYGYWRDTPQDKDSLLLARNDVSKGCEFEFIAGNAFDAFLYFLEHDYKATPFTTSTVANTKKTLQKFLESNEVNVDKLETLKKSRNLKVVAKTFHKAGIVVPYDRKSELGYRPLIVSDAELKKIFKLFEHKTGDKDEKLIASVIEKLTPIATAANIAVDECDFGTALELGIDLFCSGHKELHMLVQSLLVPAYSLLQRPQFIAISKAHMEQRRKAIHLSIFDLDKPQENI